MNTVYQPLPALFQSADSRSGACVCTTRLDPPTRLFSFRCNFPPENEEAKELGMRMSNLGEVADRFGDYHCEHCDHNQLGNTKFTMPTKMRIVGRMLGSHLVVGRVENRDGVEWKDGMEREGE